MGKKKKNLFIRLSKETYSGRINRKGWKKVNNAKHYMNVFHPGMQKLTKI